MKKLSILIVLFVFICSFKSSENVDGFYRAIMIHTNHKRIDIWDKTLITISLNGNVFTFNSKLSPQNNFVSNIYLVDTGNLIEINEQVTNEKIAVVSFGRIIIKNSGSGNYITFKRD